jgi:hypothetical protein
VEIRRLSELGKRLKQDRGLGSTRAAQSQHSGCWREPTDILVFSLHYYPHRVVLGSMQSTCLKQLLDWMAITRHHEVGFQAISSLTYCVVQKICSSISQSLPSPGATLFAHAVFFHTLYTPISELVVPANPMKPSSKLANPSVVVGEARSQRSEVSWRTVVFH